MRKVILFLVFIFFTVNSSFPDIVSQKPNITIKIGVLNFVNNSRYRGKENPAEKIPVLLEKFLVREIPYISSVPHDSLERILEESNKLSSSNIQLDDEAKIKRICQVLPVDLVIFGELKEFNLIRFSVGNPMLGGYGSYKAIVEIRFKAVRVLDNRILLDTIVKSVENEKDLDITLLGKPTQIMREFMAFDQLQFESDKFNETLIGKATLDAFRKLKSQLTEVVNPPKLRLVSREHLAPPSVVLIQDGQVYLNIGFEDGARVGDKFVIQRPGPELRDPQNGALLGRVYQEIGVVQIIQIEANHLSKAKIIMGREKIKIGDLIKTQ